VTVVNNALGSFTNNYVNATARLNTVTYPNGQTANFTYYNNTLDQRLSEIKWLNATNGVISKFNYEYDFQGQITKWTQQADAQTPKVFDLDYDAVDQLKAATVKTNSVIVKRYGYGYDKAGNRTSEQMDNGVTKSVYNNLNQLTSQSGTNGPMRFMGTLNEAGKVTLTNSGPSVTATVSTNNVFEAFVTMTTGTNTVSVLAEDYSGNKATNRYQVVVSAGVTNTLTYDLNGNLVTNVSPTATVKYEWDAADRLVAIQRTSTNRTEFVYDGLSRRTKITEIDGSATNTISLLWCGAEICEERDSGGSSIIKRYFGEGVQVSTNAYFYTRDHLSSIRELTDGANAIRARYDYDPYGRRIKLTGDLDADYAFTGHYFHPYSGLELPWFRSYDAATARWLSRDPLREAAGVNLYTYSLADPINMLDPTGFEPVLATGVGTTAAYATANAEMAALVVEGEALLGGASAVGGCTVAAGIGASVVIGGGIGYGASQLPVIGGGTVADFWGDVIYKTFYPKPQPIVNMAQRGKGNVSYDEILQIAYSEDQQARRNKDALCRKLKELMERYKSCGNTAMYEKTRSTWKDKCRGWRG